MGWTLQLMGTILLCLKNSLYDSQILITARNQLVASMMRSTNLTFLKELIEEECWSLFKQVAFLGQFFKDRDQSIKKLHVSAKACLLLQR